MKIVLAAINAKYIHSNLAVYNLKAYATHHKDKIEIAEYTINQYAKQILMDIYKKKPDILGFSCYIWNITYVKELIVNIKKILPQTCIWLGGPEVSYDPVKMLEEFPEVDIIMCGEGEETFLQLLDNFRKPENLQGIKGIVYRDEEGIKKNQMRKPMNVTDVPFVYDDLKPFENKIIYYESSRGCPFSCSYCLSSIDKKLRFRELEVVKKELQHFLDAVVAQVKFVDRTFNCNREHAYEIWKYLKIHDNGVTNFHFEIAADLLTDEEIQLFAKMRPGLIQLEIGVQSTNEETLLEICRTMKFAEVARVVESIQHGGNIHQHLDLIVGLPFEDYQSFARSFNQVYMLRPEQLQLGFLKVLKGSYMAENQSEYGLVYTNEAPYEVLYTKWLSYEDVLRLKGIEEMLELYYNSSQFEHTIPYLERCFETPFALYEALGEFYEEQGLHLIQQNRVARYEILFEFAKKHDRQHEMQYVELLAYDLYLRENIKNRPDFLGTGNNNEEKIAKFYENEEKNFHYLKGYEGFQKRQLRKMTHLETFAFDVTKDMARTECMVLFDYKNRNPLTHQATTIVLDSTCKNNAKSIK